jgi:hypothetical protein
MLWWIKQFLPIIGGRNTFVSKRAGPSPGCKSLTSISSKRILLLLWVRHCALNPLRNGIDSGHFLSFCLRRTSTRWVDFFVVVTSVSHQICSIRCGRLSRSWKTLSQSDIHKNSRTPSAAFCVISLLLLKKSFGQELWCINIDFTLRSSACFFCYARFLNPSLCLAVFF